MKPALPANATLLGEHRGLKVYVASQEDIGRWLDTDSPSGLAIGLDSIVLESKVFWKMVQPKVSSFLDFVVSEKAHEGNLTRVKDVNA